MDLSDQLGMDATGRPGGFGYARAAGQFEIRTLTPEEHIAPKAKVRGE